MGHVMVITLPQILTVISVSPSKVTADPSAIRTVISEGVVLAPCRLHQSATSFLRYERVAPVSINARNSFP